TVLAASTTGGPVSNYLRTILPGFSVATGESLDYVRPAAGLRGELTEFVGRRAELVLVRDALSSARLVTLTGPGGIGKTRLAIEAASGARRAFSDGVGLAELAACMILPCWCPRWPGRLGWPTSRRGGRWHRCPTVWRAGGFCWCWISVSTWRTRAR